MNGPIVRGFSPRKSSGWRPKRAAYPAIPGDAKPSRRSGQLTVPSSCVGREAARAVHSIQLCRRIRCTRRRGIQRIRHQGHLAAFVSELTSGVGDLVTGHILADTLRFDDPAVLLHGDLKLAPTHSDRDELGQLPLPHFTRHRIQRIPRHRPGVHIQPENVRFRSTEASRDCGNTNRTRAFGNRPTLTTWPQPLLIPTCHEHRLASRTDPP